MLTVQRLVSDMGLELAAGEGGAEAPVRWVHITELNDPTPWLSGGELLLTTGIQLGSPERQREFVQRLSDHHLAALGFGTGFDHDVIPAALLERARELDFPVFEVPYRVPFIAITERAFRQLVNEQYDVLQRGIAIHKRLERLVLEERGLDEVVRALAAAIGGSALVLSARGETMAAGAFRRGLDEQTIELVRREVLRRGGAGGTAAPFVPGEADLAGRAIALPVTIRANALPQAWLVAVRDAGGLGDFERLILQQAVTVVALELMRQRVMRDTERRLAGDLLAEALGGRLDPAELATRLRPFGVGERAAVLVLSVDDPPAGEGALDRSLGEAGVGALVATRERLLCAVVDAGDEDLDWQALASAARKALAADQQGEARVAVSRPASVATLRRSFHEARCALEASVINGYPVDHVATYRDLGAFQLLLSLQDEEALRLYCDNLLGPLENGGGDYGDELIRSLEAFIEENGQWERAARQLFCHRHTLRYRIRRIEELTGRDLSRARDRIEFWLALRGRELVG
ncbi:MAG: PucR family transcriptional regulator ligand-binding domain-containing protein [Thermoleophilaceae bacterium]|nr:PucR family transcriptional regulator ligand-binding domain-containing protein [Thermoleophilaceae bacterium]